jgi:hypothetical protein
MQCANIMLVLMFTQALSLYRKMGGQVCLCAPVMSAMQEAEVEGIVI